MGNNIQIKVEELSALPATKIAEDKKVEQKFVGMCNVIWDTGMGKQVYNREEFHFSRLLTETSALQECTKLSLFGCFLDTAVSGLSLDQSGRPQCYLIPRNVKVKAPNGDMWEERTKLVVSAYGEVYIRQRAGQVRYVDNPVVVFEGDKFRPITEVNDAKSIGYEGTFLRKSDRPVAVFIHIVRNDRATDYSWMMESDWRRLSTFSAKQNKGTANSPYTPNGGFINTRFFENEIIKHAFDAYPKVRTDNYAFMETQQEGPVIDYGLVDEEKVNEPIQSVPSVDNTKIPFGEEKQLEAPEPVQAVVSEDDENEGF